MVWRRSFTIRAAATRQLTGSMLLIATLLLATTLRMGLTPSATIQAERPTPGRDIMRLPEPPWATTTRATVLMRLSLTPADTITGPPLLVRSLDIRPDA